MNNVEWTPEEDTRLISLRGLELTYDEISEKLHGRTPAACGLRYRHLRSQGARGIFDISPYPKYNEPLVMEGNAVILPDLELPFHHAEFTNKVLDLALGWGITQAILGGDVLHFNSLSSYEPGWLKPGAKGPDGSPNVSIELKIARSEIKKLADAFERIDYVIGNHDGRFLRTLNSPLFPSELLVQVCQSENPKWRIAPYYFSHLHSNGQHYIIEHPKGSAMSTARFLADKYQAHVLMCHSHKLSFNWSRSGRYIAAEIGALVDEDRLPYAAQRHNAGPAHAVGAAIVMNGYFYQLHELVDWDALQGLYGT